MKVVIDIPEEQYTTLNAKTQSEITCVIDHGLLTKAIANGTPLPKGHGTLKDTDAICKEIISALGIRDENYLLEAEKAIYKRIKNAPAIIEADKEGEQK